MSIFSDCETAAVYLNQIKAQLQETGDCSQDGDIDSIISMLTSPFFKNLINLQGSLHNVCQLSKSPSLTDNDFNFSSTGSLILSRRSNESFAENDASNCSTLSLRPGFFGPSNSISVNSYNIEFQRCLEKAANGRQTETVSLYRPDNSTLGFSVLGWKNEENDELGVVVQDIQPAGIAAIDGRICEGDQLLAIDGKLISSVSHHQVLETLQNASGHIEFVVAHGPAANELDSHSNTIIVDKGIGLAGEILVSDSATDTNSGTVQPASKSDMVLSADWTQLEVIDLVNEGSGLGFGIIGGRSTGVVIKTILLGGVADKEGRMRSGDHVLQIGDVNVRGMSSELVALVLRQSGTHVRLIVARPIFEPPSYQLPNAPIILTSQLDDQLEQINELMHAESQASINHYDDVAVSGDQQAGTLMQDLPEIDMFEVDLIKDNNGLGITIAGYVSGDNTSDEISGIFVKSIGVGSVAAQDGHIHVNDQIIEVDRKPLQGCTNLEAVDVLRNTGSAVHLGLARFNHGPKFNKLQQCLGLELQTDVEAAIKACWEGVVGPECDVVVAEMYKFKEGGGLGISLEGTIDMENGLEVRPHHYIGSIRPDGPVGLDKTLRTNDELLEVNGKRLLGLDHIKVVEILKCSSQHVRLVCARKKPADTDERRDALVDADRHTLSFSMLPKVQTSFSGSERLCKAKSEQSLATSDVTDHSVFNKVKSRSLEPLTGLAVWSSEPVVVELEKGDSGLGFSILDYQDLLTPNDTVIVIRSLVPGGVAQRDGRLVPGDRLMFVNEINLECALLEEAAKALKGAPKGVVRIGVAKPLPVSEATLRSDFQVHHSDLRSSGQLSSMARWNRIENVHSNIPSGVLMRQANINYTDHPQNSLANDGIWQANDYSSSLLRKDSFYESDEENPFSGKPSSVIRSFEHEEAPPAYKSVINLGKSATGPFMTTHSSPLPSKQYTSYGEAYNGNFGESFQSFVEISGDTTIDSEKAYQHLGIESSCDVLTKMIQSPAIDGPEGAVIDMEPSWMGQTWTVQAADLQSLSTSSIIPPPVTFATSVNVTDHSAPPPLPSSPHSPNLTADSHAFQGKLTSESDTASSSAASFSSDHIATAERNASESCEKYDLGSHCSATRIPDELKRTVEIRKGTHPIGLSVSAAGRAEHGCLVTDIMTGGAVHLDGQLHTGDYILSINNESLSNITNTQAKAVLRRTSLTCSDVCITYVPGHSVDLISSQGASDVSPLSVDADSALSRATTTTAIGLGPEINTEIIHTKPRALPRQHSHNTDVPLSISSHAWSSPRTVALERGEGRSLGISIVGGHVDMSSAAHEHIISGIFIKHVLNDSLAKDKSLLKTGDHILEVNDIDISNATHDEAVEVIRNASSPVKFVVQSLVDSSCPKDLASSQLRQVESFEEASVDICQETAPVAQAIFEGSQSLKCPVLGDAGSDSESEDEFGYTKKKLQCRYGDLGGQLHVVEIAYDKSGLGLSLSGNKDRGVMSIFVTGIQPASPAARDGHIVIGDELLEINGVVLYGRSHLNASAIIKSVSGDKLKIVLNRHADNIDKMAVKLLNPGPFPKLVTGHLRASDVSDQVTDEPLTSNNTITIHINKSETHGLGFKIVEDTRHGRHGIFVHHITVGGPASMEGRLTLGDELLAVDQDATVGLHCEQVTELLRKTHGAVRLTVQKCDATNSASADPKSHHVLSPIVASTSPDASVSQGASPLSHEEFNVVIKSVGDGSSQYPDEATPPADPRTCHIVPGRNVYIEIDKGGTGLGLSVVGGTDTLFGGVIIHEVYVDGAAARDGRLCAGDQILEVSGKDFGDLTHDQAIQVLQQTPSCVTMTVYRDCHQTLAEDLYDIFSVELVKRSGKGLGLSIVGKKMGSGVFISDIMKGGVAESDGRLMRGDQILSVNEENMRTATQEYVASVLKTMMGKVTFVLGRMRAGPRGSFRTALCESGVQKSDSFSSKNSTYQTADINYTRSVQLDQDINGSFGFSVVGGLGSPVGDVPLVVATIQPVGPAAGSGKLQVGDIITMINGTSTDHIRHDEAIQLFKAESSVAVQVTQGIPPVGKVPQGQRLSQAKTDLLEDAVLDNVANVMGDVGLIGQCKTVTLKRGADGLGFSIVGGYGSLHGDLPIYVKNVFDTGTAAVDGTLHHGDQILSVNGLSLDGISHDEAVDILKNARGEVTLTVLS